MPHKVSNDTPTVVNTGEFIEITQQPVASDITATQVRMTSSCNIVCQALGQVRVVGDTAWIDKNIESSFQYSMHVQTVGSLAPSTDWEYRVIFTGPAGNQLISDIGLASNQVISNIVTFSTV